MKKTIAMGVLVALLGIAAPSFAQDTTSVPKKVGHTVKKGAKKAWRGTKKGAKTVGNETAELATKAKAKATDKEYEGWVGPNGQKVYVDDGSKYYWINESGKRVFVKQHQLRRRQ